MSDQTNQSLPALPTGSLSRNRWRDAIAGLSIAGLLLPQALAYSSIGNLPPQAGIIALFAGLICYGLFGTSRFAIVSATSSSAIVLAASMASMADGDVALRLTMSFGLVMITGLIFLVAGLARMGNITDFIAKPVLRGFTFGLAIVIILKQCALVLDVETSNHDMFNYLLELIEQFSHWNIASIATSALALVLLFLLERVRRLPGGVIVLLLGIAAGKWLNLEHYGVDLIGSIQLELSTPTMPHLSQTDWLQLFELGFAMVFILYAESYGSIRSFAIKHGDSVLPNRDLLALGASNLVSGLLQGMPVGAGYSATAANEKYGAKSRWAGLAAALIVLVIVLTMLPAIALIPKPVLAAIVIHAVSHTLSLATFKPYFAWRRDRLEVIAAVIGVLALGVLEGLLVAVGISLILMLRQLSASTIGVLGRLGSTHDFVNLSTHPDAKILPGFLILRPDQAIFFANADRMMGRLREIFGTIDPSIHTIILSLEESPDLDSTSIEALRDFSSFALGKCRHLIFARVKDPTYEVLQRAIDPIFPNLTISRRSVADAVGLAQTYEYTE